MVKIAKCKCVKKVVGENRSRAHLGLVLGHNCCGDPGQLYRHEDMPPMMLSRALPRVGKHRKLHSLHKGVSNKLGLLAATAGVVADLIPTVEVDTTVGWCVPGA